MTDADVSKGVQIFTLPELLQYFQAQPKSRRLIVMAGPQGSGKSYLAKRLKRLRSDDCGYRLFKRLSADKLKKRSPWLTDAEAEREYMTALKRSLENAHNIVDDNLNASDWVRKKVIDLARSHGYEHISIVYIDLPLARCLSRNAARSRPTADWIVRKVWEKFYRDGLPQACEAEVIRIKPLDDRVSYELSVTEYKPTSTVAPSGKSPKVGLPVAFFQRVLRFWRELTKSLNR